MKRTKFQTFEQKKCQQLDLTLTKGVLLVEVQVGMNVRVLVMMRGDVEHLQPGGWISRHRGHPLSMKPFRSQSLGVTQLWAHLRPSQRQPLALQVAQPRMEGSKRVGWSGYVGQSQRPVSSKVLQVVG